MSTALTWQSSDEQLLAELGELEAQLHATWAQMLSVVTEVDSGGPGRCRGVRVHGGVGAGGGPGPS